MTDTRLVQSMNTETTLDGQIRSVEYVVDTDLSMITIVPQPDCGRLVKVTCEFVDEPDELDDDDEPDEPSVPVTVSLFRRSGLEDSCLFKSVVNLDGVSRVDWLSETVIFPEGQLLRILIDPTPTRVIRWKLKFIA